MLHEVLQLVMLYLSNIKSKNAFRKKIVLLPFFQDSLLCKAFNPLSINPTKWSDTLKHKAQNSKLLPTNHLSVFDYFVELALKRLIPCSFVLALTCPISIFKELRRSDFTLHFQGYIRYKTIASQNMPFEAPVKDFFVSKESYVPFSGYSSFCIFNRTMICKIYDVMMSINTCDRVRF